MKISDNPERPDGPPWTLREYLARLRVVYAETGAELEVAGL